MNIRHATELLASGERAIVIFTRGNKLHQSRDGSGWTGNWKLDPARHKDVVIIYRQFPDRTGADVFVGRHTRTERSDEKGRSRVHFSDASSSGRTDLNWKQFSGGSQNPVRYLEAA